MTTLLVSPSVKQGFDYASEHGLEEFCVVSTARHILAHNAVNTEAILLPGATALPEMENITRTLAVKQIKTKHA